MVPVTCVTVLDEQAATGTFLLKDGGGGTMGSTATVGWRLALSMDHPSGNGSSAGAKQHGILNWLESRKEFSDPVCGWFNVPSNGLR